MSVEQHGQEMLDQLQPAWMAVMNKLSTLFPESEITGRLRADIYFQGDGLLSEDSAGTRIVLAHAADLESALQKVIEHFSVCEIRDYRDGHHRAAYYRGVHVYVYEGSFKVEVQLRTRRQHRIAEWAHEHLLLPHSEDCGRFINDPLVYSYLKDLSSYFDVLDRGVDARNQRPQPPPVLLDCLEELGS